MKNYNKNTDKQYIAVVVCLLVMLNQCKQLNLLFIDPFSVSKHCDIFLWAELRWWQKDSTDRFTNASYEVC